METRQPREESEIVDGNNDNGHKKNMFETDETNENLVIMNSNNNAKIVEFGSRKVTQTNSPSIVQSRTSPTGAFSEAGKDFDEGIGDNYDNNNEIM